MATIQQGILAGQLANNLNRLAAFIAALQAAQTANGSLQSLQIVLASGSSFTFFPDAGVSAADSAVLFSSLITLCQSLQSEWTAQLAAL